MLEQVDLDNCELNVRSNKISKEFRLKMCRYRKSRQFVDIKLTAGQSMTSIDGHKIILSLNSEYFEKLFTANFNDAQDERVTIHGIHHRALEIVVNYFYTGHLQINMNNLDNVLSVADLLLLEDVKAAIFRFLGKILDFSNCLHFKDLADLYSETKASKIFLKFMGRNFQKLNKANLGFQDVMNILDSEELQVDSEDEVLDFIAEWVSEHCDKVEIDLDQMISKLNIALLSPDKISSLKCPELKLKISQKVSNLPEDAKINVVRSKKSSNVVVFCAFDSKTLEYFNVNDLGKGLDNLTELPSSMKYGFCGAGMAASGANIFVTGGVGKNGILKAVNSFYIYNLDTQVWTEGPNMTHSRKNHACGIADGNLLVAGGTDEQLPILSVEYISIKNIDQPGNGWKIHSSLDSWHSGPSLFQIGSNFAVLSAFGAENDRMFQSGAQVWTNLLQSAERSARDHPGMALIPSSAESEDQIMVAGGTIGDEISNVVELFSSREQQWNRIEDLNVARSGPGLVQVGNSESGKVFAIGGKGSEGTIEVYDHHTKRWETLNGVTVKYENEEYFAVHCES